MDRLLTVKEAAILLRISQSKLYCMVKENAVPHVMLGGRVIIPERSLSAWIESSVRGG